MYTGPHLIKDNLVFGYDTGYGIADNSTATRFYPGEPTTNLADTDAKRSFGVHGGNSSTTSSAPEYGLGWKKLIVTNIAGSNYRLAQFPYLSQADGTSRTYSVEYDVTGLTGYSLFVDGNIGYGPTSISGRGRYSFTTGAVSGVKDLAIFIGKSGTHSNINHVIYYKEYQVELNPYPTPFVSGTRSSTQSLIDLKRTTDIDVSNVSFDSTGQPTFDGTDDILNTGVFSGRNPATDPFTIEAIVKSDTTSVARMWLDATSNGTNQRLYCAHAATGTGNPMGIQGTAWNSSGVSDTDFHHYVIVMDGSVARLYNNGVSHSTRNYTSYGIQSLNVGGRNGYRWVGTVPVFKIHNQVLTADQVKQNYNAYKNRFDI